MAEKTNLPAIRKKEAEHRPRGYIHDSLSICAAPIIMPVHVHAAQEKKRLWSKSDAFVGSVVIIRF